MAAENPLSEGKGKKDKLFILPEDRRYDKRGSIDFVVRWKT